MAAVAAAEEEAEEVEAEVVEGGGGLGAAQGRHSARAWFISQVRFRPLDDRR